MTVRIWDTRQAIDPDFERAWRDRLARSPHAHFEFDPAFLTWEARQGRGMRAVLLDDADRRAALLLGAAQVEAVCGRPWRWDALVEGEEGTGRGFTAAEADWLFQQAQRAAGARRLRCFLPWAPRRSTPHYLAGATIVQTLAETDDQLMKRFDATKRRSIRKCAELGYEILETTDHQHLRAFAALQRAIEARHGHEPGGRGRDALPADPPAGQAWREWELPWMWLLVALKDGAVQAGSGFGLYPGATVD